MTLRPSVPPVRQRLVAVMAGVTLLGGCALNGDFGRVRSSLTTDDMHAWVGREAVGSIGFVLRQDVERLAAFHQAVLHSRAWQLIQWARRPFGRAW